MNLLLYGHAVHIKEYWCDVPKDGRPNVQSSIGDDMLVKSRMARTHADDLQEAIITMRKYGMRLNPSKCAFGV